MEGIFRGHFFGVPLHSDEEPIWVNCFSGFNDSVGTLSNESETFAESADCLMVE